MPNTVTASTEQALVPRLWLGAPLALMITLVLLEGTDVDRIISHWFFDAGSQTFPLRQAFLLDTVLHHWAKYAVILTSCIIMAVFAFSFLVPILRPQRRGLLFLALAMTLAPLAVTSLKQFTDRPCPWDLTDFGGAVPYTRLFEAREQPHARGLCFPAGHAATGFTLLAFFFVAHRERHRTLARTALLAGTAAGLVLGIGRIAQGAHFMSHVLWSGLVCWVVMVGLYAMTFAPRPRIGTIAGE